MKMSRFGTLRAAGGGEVAFTVEMLRPLSCLTGSVRVGRIIGRRPFLVPGASIARDPASCNCLARRPEPEFRCPPGPYKIGIQITGKDVAQIARMVMIGADETGVRPYSYWTHQQAKPGPPSALPPILLHPSADRLPCRR